MCAGHGILPAGVLAEAQSPYTDRRGGRKLTSVRRASRVVAALVTAAVGTAAPAVADPSADLLSKLPAGYDSDSCEPADPAGALAALICRDNALPDGPTFATYWLFADDYGMHAAFTAQLASPDWAPTTCPGSPSADAVVVLGSDGQPYGRIACGRGTGADWLLRDGAVAWTHDADHFLGVAYTGYQGQAFPAGLFEWAKGKMT